MAEAESGAAGGYVAFISYSHRDAAVGRWLHRRLEGYRLPTRLAGTEGEEGEVPSRLTPIFRDRDDLPAAGDLSEKVRAALAVSRNLIVVCSPSSAASPWVAKEITTFRELHPDRPIFTAIVDGEPDQCFPPILCEGGVEPLAADLRKEGDGRRLGLLKLVAGLAGVGLDALVQRDATRRIRRISYLTAGAVAAMLLMGLLTAFALNARAEAQRQRADAEGLVEFMLTDLRNKLRAVGRVDIMEAVNQRALARYGGGEALGSLSGEQLSRRARFLHAIAEDQITLGDTSKARTAAEEAYRTTAEQLSRERGNPQRQLEHARSIYWIGRVHEVRKEWPEARHQYALFAVATDRLLAAFPNNAEYMREAGWSRIDLGNVQLGTGDFAGAEQHYEEALDRFRRAFATRPDDETARIIANGYGWLADSFYMRGLFQASLDARQRQYRIAHRLYRKYPRDADEAYRFAIARRAVAKSLAKVGQGNRARTELIEAGTIATRLSLSDPRNGDWLMLRAMIGCDLLYTKAAALPVSKRGYYRAEVIAAADALIAAGNPRASEISNCVRAIRKG
jgi:tetratricopeptide (TPR) repeat protein